MRTEYDTMGAVEVPDDAYYGAQTQRAVENFPISGKTMPPELIHALGLVKWACAKANAELGLLQSGHSPLNEQEIEALLTACLEVAEGKFDAQFPVDVYQTGSGTSTNMNANEVIARRANEIIGDRRQTADGRRQQKEEDSFNQRAEGATDVGLSGPQSGAEGDGFNSGNLSVSEKIAEGGNLRSVRSDEAVGSLDSIEHSGGKGQEFQQGVHPISAHREGVEVGIGNATSDKCQSGLSDRIGHSTSNGNEQRNRQHVDSSDSPVNDIELADVNPSLASGCCLPSAVCRLHPSQRPRQHGAKHKRYLSNGDTRCDDISWKDVGR
jgi:hypothetical protein